MEKKIITISREFGSGGRTIGHKVAEKLGIPFYDKELVDHIAMESGFGQISCFNRSFSKIFGQTPTAFRKNSRNPANIAEPVERMQNGH